MDHYGSSVLALRGRTGEVVWRFQTVHHDLWDYDVPGAAAADDRCAATDARSRPSSQATKMGMLFVLNRETGEPLFPVEERPVPQDGVPDEPSLADAALPHACRRRSSRHRALGPTTPGACSASTAGGAAGEIESLRHGDIYTPPTTQGTLVVARATPAARTGAASPSTPSARSRSPT